MNPLIHHQYSHHCSKAPQFMLFWCVFLVTSGMEKEDGRAPDPASKPQGFKYLGSFLLVLLVCFSSYFFAFIEKTPTVQQQLASSRTAVSPAALRLKYDKCKRLLWFMCLNDVTEKGDADYNTYIKAALLSAQKNAPSLVPYLIVEGSPSKLTTWFEDHGKKIHVAFYKFEGLFLFLPVKSLSSNLKVLVAFASSQKTQVLYTSSGLVSSKV